MNYANTTIATGDHLDVRWFSVRSGMSELFTVELRVVSRNLDIDFDEVIGNPAELTLTTKDGVEKWHGVCREMEQTRVEEQGLATYRLVIVPQAWLLTQRKNYRIFQYQSELEIVKQILGEWGIEHEARVDAGAHKARKFRVQYGETDFAFVSRMLEEAAISYFFEPSDAGMTLVLDDEPQSRDLSQPLLQFHDVPGRNASRYVTKVSVGSRARPGAMRIGDLDFRRESTKQPAQSATMGLPQEAELEQFDYEPGAFLFTAPAGGSTPAADDRGAARTDDAAGAKKTQDRLLSRRNDAKVVRLESDVLGLRPGVITNVLNHPHRGVAPDKSLLVTAARLEADHDKEWRVEVEAVHASQPYRPTMKTPKPLARGVESATVVGPTAEEIHTDEYARVRVHFHWDRESTRDEKSSCWLPTNQPWAGKSYGAINLPRVGQEVLVEFLGGDPDRPVVIGRVYTDPNPPPDPLPKYKHVAGIFSEATPRMVMGAAGDASAGGNLSPMGGTPLSPQQINDTVTQPGPFQAVSPTGTNHKWPGSGMKLDDMSGAENLYIQANRDLHLVVWNNWSTVIGNHRATKIGTDDFLRVEKNQGIRIDNEQRTDVKNDCKSLIGGNRADKVGKQMTQSSSNGDIVYESSVSNLTIGAKKVIRFESDEKIQFQAGKKSLVQISPNDISFLAGANKVDVNPKGSKTPSESVTGISLNPDEQAAREAEQKRKEAEREARLAPGRQERLQRGRDAINGLPDWQKPRPNGGENAFARQEMYNNGVTDRQEQDQLLQEYFQRDTTDMR